MSRIVVATAFGGPEVLRVEQADVAPPGRGEVSIKVRAAGVNPVDVKSYAGHEKGHDESKLPLRLGVEASGVVTAAGADARGPAGPVAVGDEVIAYRVLGAYADTVTVPAGAVVPKPPGLSWETASAMMLTGTTAIHLLTATGVTDGDCVLIHGAAGGVGSIAAQIAVRDGARVIGTAAEHQFDRLRSYGVIPVTYGEGLLDRVRSVAPVAWVPRSTRWAPMRPSTFRWPWSPTVGASRPLPLSTGRREPGSRNSAAARAPTRAASKSATPPACA